MRVRCINAAPTERAPASIQRKISPFNPLQKLRSPAHHATFCQLGFVRGIPGSLVGFSGSIVDSPGSFVDSSGSFAGFSAEMSRSMTITNAYGA